MRKLQPCSAACRITWAVGQQVRATPVHSREVSPTMTPSQVGWDESNHLWWASIISMIFAMVIGISSFLIHYTRPAVHYQAISMPPVCSCSWDSFQYDCNCVKIPLSTKSTSFLTDIYKNGTGVGLETMLNIPVRSLHKLKKFYPQFLKIAAPRLIIIQVFSISAQLSYSMELFSDFFFLRLYS